MGNCSSVKSKKHLTKNKIIVRNSLRTSTLNNNNNNYNNGIVHIQIHLNITIIESSTTKKLEILISSSEKLSKIFEILDINKNCDYDVQLTSGPLLNHNPELTLYEILLPYFPNGFKNNIDINLFYKGLDIPDDIKQAYINKNSIIGSAIFDNLDCFTIITYERETESIKPYFYNLKNNDSFSKFNSFTAYCNANGVIYISGGESEQSEDFEKSVVKYKDFFCIDLKKLKENEKNFKFQELQNLLEPRTWHSMIFVPNKYIFIVGGPTKSVEIYDIELNYLFKDSELNEIRNECTLCLVNNIYLYAFCGFLLHRTFNNTIEKCNLRKSCRKWEYINYNLVGNIKFNPSFFAVSYFQSNHVLLIGGNDSTEEKNKDYLIKIGNDENFFDEISEFNVNQEKIGVFRDKLFTPIDNNIAINIPLIYGDNIQILKIDMNNGIIEQKIIKDIFEN